MARRLKHLNMNEVQEVPRVVIVQRLDRDTMAPELEQQIAVAIDGPDLRRGGQKPETWGFKKTADLRVPSMLDLPARTQGNFTDVMIDLAAPVFPVYPDHIWEVVVRLRGKVLATRQFRNFTQRHQIILPISALFEDVNALRLEARALEGKGMVPRFYVRVFYVQQDRLQALVERDSVWVFSVARSGSSWLSQDILCHDHTARSMDEPGIGRLFAPLDWVAERFYDLANKAAHVQSGLDYETKAKRRDDAGFIPVFERSFMFGHQENSIWSAQNRAMYLDLIRTTVFQHVLHEWGVIDYQHTVFKMPNDSHGADVIMQALPDAFMILLMRDGRDVMKSRFSPFASPDLATTTDAALRLHAIAFYAHLWNFQVDIMQAAFAGHAPERRLLLRYEDLRVNPTPQLREMFDRIGMAIDDAALDALVTRTRLENIPAAEKGPDKPRQTGQIGKYANVFSDPEIALMEAIMGRNLRRFGYKLVTGTNTAATADAGGFVLSMADDVFETGWYRAEGAAESPFRWTGPEQISTIDVNLAPGRYRVLLSYDRPVVLADERLTVTANGTELDVDVRATSDMSRNAWIELPEAVVLAGGGAVRLALDVGAVVRPSDHGGADQRELGVVVFRVEFEAMIR